MPVVTFAQLPDEEEHFLAYLRTTGDIWARAVNDDPIAPRFAPLPVADFLAQAGHAIAAYDSVDVYLGFRDDIFQPAVRVHEHTEGGTPVPFIQDGRVLEGVHTIVGGTIVQRPAIDPMASFFIRYSRGEFRRPDELSHSNLSHYSIRSGDEARCDRFARWAKKVFAWMRRQTPASVPVHRCNYNLRATARVAAACEQGLKVGV